jgi:hypothetical protein
MAKSDKERREDTERKLDIATTFLAEAIEARLRAGTWGKITVVAIVEGGFVKEVILSDDTIVRDIPKAIPKSTTVRLTNSGPAA